MITTRIISRRKKREFAKRLANEIDLEIEIPMNKKKVKTSYCINKITNCKTNKMPSLLSSTLLLLPLRHFDITSLCGASNGQHKTQSDQDKPINSTSTTSRRKSTRSSNEIVRSKNNSRPYNITINHRKRKQHHCVSPSQSLLVFLIVMSIVSLTIVLEHLPGSDRSNKIKGINNASPFLQVEALQINWPSSSTNSHQLQQQQQLSTIPSLAATANTNLQNQLLQVFNGNESQVAELNRFKIMEIYGDFLLIGAR